VLGERGDRVACIAVVVAGLLAGCASGDDVDASDPEERQEAIATIFDDVLTAAEAQCFGDLVFADEAVDAEAVLAFAEEPEPDGPLFDLYREGFAACFDPTVPLPPVAAEGDLRDGVIAGIRSTIADVTDDEATCLLDALLELGVGVRELTAAGYVPAQAEVLQSAFASAATTCLPTD